MLAITPSLLYNKGRYKRGSFTMITKDYALHAMWGLILLIFGYTINEASESFEKINTKLESLEIMVASDYVRKQDLNRFEAKIDHMNDMIINLIKEQRHQ